MAAQGLDFQPPGRRCHGEAWGPRKESVFLIEPQRMYELISQSAKETQELGAVLGRMAQPGWVMGLDGDLGAGKTTLVQGVVAGAGGDPDRVTSPTFGLMHEYSARLPIYHFDLYRLESTADVLNIGFEEFVYGDGLALIEWLDRFEDLVPTRCLRIRLETLTLESRRLTLEPLGEGWDPVIQSIQDEVG
jgi:tRNA threonylcarbamoyladenosine biosynthesis protein TsaE